MTDILQTQAAQIVIGIAGLAILITAGVYLVLKFRDSSDSTESPVELMAKFQEMRQEGHINEEEYRTIKTDLNAKLSMQSRARPADSHFDDEF